MSAIHALPLLIQMDNESHCDIPSISKLFYSFQCIASLFSRQVTLSITLCHLFAKLCIYLSAKRKERKSCSVLVQWILICSNRSPEKGFVECNRINDNLQLSENTIYVEELPIPAVIFCCVVFTIWGRALLCIKMTDSLPYPITSNVSFKRAGCLL